jgi:hypothetical protein
LLRISRSYYIKSGIGWQEEILKKRRVVHLFFTNAGEYAAMEKEKGRISHAFPGFCRML